MNFQKTYPDTLKYAQDYSSPILPKEIAEVLCSLRADTANRNLPMRAMISEPFAKLMIALIHILSAQNILEIGTFTGYSAIAMASALSVQGKLTTLDINPETQSIARQYAEIAGLQDKIEFRLGAAVDSLEKMAAESPRPQFDFIFIDADKQTYAKYVDLILDNNLLSDHGVIICDNVLRRGRVFEHAGYAVENPQPENDQHGSFNDAKDVHEFNVNMASDPRVQSVILPVYDGVSILRRIQSASDHFSNK